VGREGAFFLYQLNIHTFNLESRRLYKDRVFNHRTDRRVEELVAEGWVGGGWVEEWVDRWAGLRVGFININDMYNNDVGKGGAQGCEAYEVK
jgi:hypothetical protein